MREAGTDFTGRLTRTSGRVWSADPGAIKSPTRFVGRIPCKKHHHSNSLISLSSNFPINSFTVSASLTSNTGSGSGLLLGSSR